MQLPTFKRDITKEIHKRLSADRHFLQVVTGPRQVGKTTAVLQVLDSLKAPHHYAVADLPAPPPPAWITQQWDVARRKANTSGKAILVLDEAQKIKSWSEEVKRLWDEDSREGKNINVAILGSSSLLIQKGLTESLGGRFESVRLTHWSWPECRDCFGWPLDTYLYFGGYPGAASLIEEGERWSKYIKDSIIETVFSKDIFLLNQIEKPALLRQLFVLACEYAGQVLSYQKVLGQLSDAGNTTTLSHYQNLLESAYLIRGLSKWAGGSVRIRKSSPKWLPLTTSLMNALSGRNFDELRNDPEAWGRVVEAAVGAHLVNEGDKRSLDIYYWREGNAEVDYVLRKGKKIIALEVKSGKKKTSLAGLGVFTKRFSGAKTLVVGPGGVELEEFLSTPVPEWFG